MSVVSYPIVFVMVCQRSYETVVGTQLEKERKIILTHEVSFFFNFSILGNSKKIGDSITLISGRASHSKASDGHSSGETYRGRYSTELSVALHLVTSTPGCPMPNGLATLSKRKLLPHGVRLMELLYEYEFERLIKNSEESEIASMPGSLVRQYITDAGWMWKGFLNMKLLDHLSPYESAKCFRGIREYYHRNGTLMFCDCPRQSRCILKRSLLAILGVGYDFVVQMNAHGVKFTLSDIFDRGMVDHLVSYCTSNSNEPGIFVASADVGFNFVLHSHATKLFLVDRRLNVKYLYNEEIRCDWADQTATS